MSSELEICTKIIIWTKCIRWVLTAAQEEVLNVTDIVKDKDTVLIQTKYDEPKCGVKDIHGNVVGFVHTSYSAKLKALRNLINGQIIPGSSFSDVYQFVDENSWPVSIVQESLMAVQRILNGHCVSTTLQNNLKSPSRCPPFKKLKFDPERSFRSVKDITRQLNSDSGKRPSAKQVLISYVRSEAESHALKLKEQLNCQGCSVYLDLHEIQTGMDWQDSLNIAVRECEVFVPLVTCKYGETQWTNREVKLADVLGKYILPVSFLTDWPPRCLAIQFATTQYIPWISGDGVQELKKSSDGTSNKLEWTASDVTLVAEKICNRLQGLQLASVPSLIKRATVVKSCPCVSEDNPSAIASDREGKPLVMVCLHPDQSAFGEQLRTKLMGEDLEVWCTTQMQASAVVDKESATDSHHASEENSSSHYSASVPGCNGHWELKHIQTFQEKADDASVVVLVLSEVFTSSQHCKKKLFYCEHRKRVIPVLYEEFKMPDWLTMLVGSHGLERVSDEDFQDVLLHRIKSAIDPAARMRRNSTSSFTPRKRSLSASPDSNHGFNNGLSPKVLQLSRGVEERQIEVTSPVRSSRNSEQEGESHIGSKPSLTTARTLIL